MRGAISRVNGNDRMTGLVKDLTRPLYLSDTCTTFLSIGGEQIHVS
jgi:hypothetical protein